MSDRRILRLALVAIGFVPLAHAAAQHAADPGGTLLQRYRRTRDSLAAFVRATEAADAAQVVKMRSSFGNPFVRGSITVLTATEVADRTSQALARADSIVSRTPLGGPMKQMLTLRLHVPWEHLRLPPGERKMWILDVLDASGAEVGGEWWNGEESVPDIEHLSTAIASLDRTRRWKLMPPKLLDWLGGSLLNLDMDQRWVETYTRIATSPSTIANACLLGNIGACRQILLIDVTKDPVTEWYTPATRRLLVKPYQDGGNYTQDQIDRKLPGARVACVLEGDDNVCQRIMREYMGPQGWADPLRSPAGREALLVAAIQMPGAPGLSPLLGRMDIGAVAALEAIANKPIDDIIRAWLARVRAAEPDRVQMPAARLLTASAWVLVFGALALRGTRWRSV